jgi:hypothetical protein
MQPDIQNNIYDKYNYRDNNDISRISASTVPGKHFDDTKLNFTYVGRESKYFFKFLIDFNFIIEWRE